LNIIKEESASNIDCIVCAALMRHIFNRGQFGYYRCPSCQTVTTLPYPTLSQIQKHYREGFENGNYNVASKKCEDIYRYGVSNFVDVIEAHLLKHNQSFNRLKVLDIGCFTGEFLYQVQQKGAEVFGIELQGDAVKIANQRLSGRVVQGNILTDTPFPDAHFDIVTLSGVIEHVTDPICLLRKSTELLDPGGFLVIESPDASSLWARIMKKIWPPFTPVEHIHLFSHRSLCLILNRLGFTVPTIKRHWKKLTFTYVYEMSKTFGPEIHKIAAPFYYIIPKFLKNMILPFYVGEMIVIAQKKKI